MFFIKYFICFVFLFSSVLSSAILSADEPSSADDHMRLHIYKDAAQDLTFFVEKSGVNNVAPTYEGTSLRPDHALKKWNVNRVQDPYSPDSVEKSWPLTHGDAVSLKAKLACRGEDGHYLEGMPSRLKDCSALQDFLLAIERLPKFVTQEEGELKPQSCLGKLFSRENLCWAGVITVAAYLTCSRCGYFSLRG